MMYLTYQRENWYQEAGSFWQSAGQTMYYILSTFGEDDWLFTWVFQGLAMAYMYTMLAFEQKKLPFDLAAYSFVYVAVCFRRRGCFPAHGICMRSAPCR